MKGGISEVNPISHKSEKVSDWGEYRFYSSALRSLPTGASCFAEVLDVAGALEILDLDDNFIDDVGCMIL